jgi:hypothetical protein
VDKQSLLDDLRGVSNIPVESNQVQPVADVSELNLSSGLDQLIDLSKRIREEIMESNKAFQELFVTDALEDKENSSEEQALRPTSDSQSEVLSAILSQITSVFDELTAALIAMKSQNGDGGGVDISDLLGGKKKWLRKFTRGLKGLLKNPRKLLPSAGTLSKLAKVGGAAAIVGGAGAAAKDAYDIGSGSDGGANAKNVGGVIGSTIGAGIGVGISTLFGLGTGGAGLLAGGAIVGTTSGLGNMLGEYVGSAIDGESQAVKPSSPQQNTLPSDSPAAKALEDAAKSGGSGGEGPGSNQSSSYSKADIKPSASITSSEMSSPTETSSVEPVDISQSTAPEMVANSDSQMKLETVTAEAAADTGDEILPPITMNSETGVVSSRANVGPAGSMSAMSSSDIPSPIYSGSAVSTLIEMYV